VIDPIDFALIGVFIILAVVFAAAAQYLLLRPRKPKLPVERGKQLEETVLLLLAQFGFNYEDRRKSGASATPDFLVKLPNGKVGLEAKNVSELSSLASVHNEKVIRGCKLLDALPLYVVDMQVNYDERQGIPVIPLHSLVPVLKLLGQGKFPLEFKDEFGIRQNVEELLQFEPRFKMLFDKLRKVKETFDT